MTLHPLDAETATVEPRYAVETNQVSRDRWRRANRPSWIQGAREMPRQTPRMGPMAGNRPAKQAIKPWFASAAALLQCCSVGIQILYSCTVGVCASMTFTSAAFCCPGRRLGNSCSSLRRSLEFALNRSTIEARRSGTVGLYFSLADAC
jgi:hypothetical protein